MPVGFRNLRSAGDRAVIGILQMLLLERADVLRDRCGQCIRSDAAHDRLPVDAPLSKLNQSATRRKRIARGSAPIHSVECKSHAPALLKQAVTECVASGFTHHKELFPETARKNLP